MGNFNLYSKTTETEEPVPIDQSFSSHVNDIAIHYILKQNVIDLLRLTDKEYADNLIVLVSSVFDKNLTHEEIGLLNSHIESETIQEAILDLIPSNETAKKKMLMNISKYYIKIMMIYSAIVSTLDPQYMYEDETGEKHVFYLKDVQQLKKIPKGVVPILQQLTNPMNLCKRRITILKNKLDDTEDDVYILNPGEKVCASEGKRTLNDEVGIKELDLLYYDVFDYGQKTWKTRSPEMEEKYNRDLTIFYQTFTGEEERPKIVKSFKDIELLDFRSLSYCTDPLFTKEFTVPKTNPYIKRYVEEIKRIEEETKLYRETLNEKLNVLFTMNTKNGESTYSINPKLTMKIILETEEEAREIIRALYTDCERRFVNALILFEKIYDEQTKDLKQQQYNQLQKGNILNTNRNKRSLEDEVDVEEEPLYNKALYVNKPIPLPEYYKEPAKEPEPIQKQDVLNTGLEGPNETKPFGLDTPLSESNLSTNTDIKPEEKSWFSGITDTIGRFSAPALSKDASDNKVADNEVADNKVADNEVADNKLQEKDTFGQPLEKNMFGYPKTPEPVVEKNMFGYPKTPEPVEKNMFGYPKTPEPVVNKPTNTNTFMNESNRKNTNIVLKPLKLPIVNKPDNEMNTFMEKSNKQPIQEPIQDRNFINKNKNLTTINGPSNNRPEIKKDNTTNMPQNRQEKKPIKNRNMFGQIEDDE